MIKVLDSNGDELRDHVTKTGLCFTSTSEDAPSFQEFFLGLEETLDTVDFTTRPYRRRLKYEGHFNWKTMVDGNHERLPCQYVHPSFSVLYQPTSDAIGNHHNGARHIADAIKSKDVTRR